MTDLTDRLDAIQAQLDAATPGPWFQGRDSNRYESVKEVYSEREPSRTSEDLCTAWHPADAEFIASAPENTRFLLDLARKQQAAIEAVRELAEDAAAQPPSEIIPVPALAVLIRKALESKP